jgi:D-alanyl-D-alanine carboxypeptidase
MVRSANDVATAVAENVGGSEEAFVARMNAEARRLGMTGTQYANAHGLHSDASTRPRAIRRCWRWRSAATFPSTRISSRWRR